MTPITEPLVEETDTGSCGVVIIAESHISVHVQGLKVYGDVISCKEFNLKTAMDLATKRFGLDRVRRRRLERGWVNVPRRPSRYRRDQILTILPFDFITLPPGSHHFTATDIPCPS